MRIAKNYNRDPSALEVLLLRNILVGRQQHCEPSLFSECQEIAVLHSVPTGFFSDVTVWSSR